MEQNKDIKSVGISDNLYITINSVDIALCFTILSLLYFNMAFVENKYVIGINFGVNLIYMIISLISLLTYFTLKTNKTFFHKIYCWTRFFFYSFMMKLAIGVVIYIIYCFCLTIEKNILRNIVVMLNGILFFLFALYQFRINFKLKREIMNNHKEEIKETKLIDN